MPYLCPRGHVKPTTKGRDGIVVCRVCARPVMRVAAGTKEGVGYHYTAFSSWEEIQEDGLRPYELARGAEAGPGKAKFLADVGDQDGVYLWAQPPSPAAHVGYVVQRAMARRVWRIVLVRARFDLRDVIELEHVLTHTGSFAGADLDEEPWLIHVREPAVLVAAVIPPDRLELVGDWDLKSLVAVAKGAPRTRPGARGAERR